MRTGEVPADRPADAHDILGTHRIVADPVERRLVPTTPDELLAQLLRWHATIMQGRPDTRPGHWKARPNQAGSYLFVQPDLVEGTLLEGFERLHRLTLPLARALYLMFIISEVHPFDDGNGRVARALMNAELSAAGEARILVPTVWRNEYLTALRQLSRRAHLGLYVRTLAFAQQWTARIPWNDAATVRAQLDATNALVDSTEAEQTGIRLELPT